MAKKVKKSESEDCPFTCAFLLFKAFEAKRKREEKIRSVLNPFRNFTEEVSERTMQYYPAIQN
jgi:hypothetical protein